MLVVDEAEQVTHIHTLLDFPALMIGKAEGIALCNGDQVRSSVTRELAFRKSKQRRPYGFAPQTLSHRTDFRPTLAHPREAHSEVWGGRAGGRASWRAGGTGGEPPLS